MKYPERLVRLDDWLLGPVPDWPKADKRGLLRPAGWPTLLYVAASVLLARGFARVVDPAAGWYVLGALALAGAVATDRQFYVWARRAGPREMTAAGKRRKILLAVALLAVYIGLAALGVTGNAPSSEERAGYRAGALIMSLLFGANLMLWIGTFRTDRSARRSRFIGSWITALILALQFFVASNWKTEPIYDVAAAVIPFAVILIPSWDD